MHFIVKKLNLKEIKWLAQEFTVESEQCASVTKHREEENS